MEMKSLFLWSIFLITLNAQWEWKGNKLPVFHSMGWAIDAYDSLNAVIAIIPQQPPSDQTLYITTDGGINWEYLSLGVSRWIVDVSMVTPEKLWICSTEPHNEIWVTSDGGLTWKMQFDANSLTPFFNYMEMFDTLNGIAMGDSPDSLKPALFLKTSDGGINWLQTSQNYFISSVSANVWRRLSFTDKNTGYFSPYGKPEDFNCIFRTTDAGDSWSKITSSKGDIEIIKFFNENYGFTYINHINATGRYIFRTSDGGIHWDSTFITSDRLSTAGHGSDFEFLPDDPEKVWFTTLDTLYFSSDSGKTWTKDNLSESFIRGQDLKIVDGKVCWFLCGTVYRNLNANTIVSVDNEKIIPSEFMLFQNYPNPFNPSTTIKYNIKEPSPISLKVYNILGSEIRTLVNEYKKAGSYSVNFNASDLPSGCYIYVLRSGDFNKAFKMIFLK